MDVVTTWYAITRTGASEGNIFLKYLVESNWKWRWLFLSGLKATFVTKQARIALWWNGRFDPVETFRAELYGCGFIWAVVLWNCFVIVRRTRRVIPA